MTEQTPEPTNVDESKPEPLKLDVPVYDYVEKSGSPEDLETRDGRAKDKE